MAIITATAVLNFAYPSGGGSSGDWQQPQDPCVVAGGPTVFGGQCSDAKQNGLSYDTLQRIVEEVVSGLRPADAALTNDLTSGIFERLQELRQPVGDAESLAMLTRILADVQTNGDDPATLGAIREFLESGQTGLTGPLQTILDRLLSGDLDGALGELGDLIAELQASSGSPEEIARLEGLLRDGASRWDATFESL
ncbi:MAG: hypothetical protein HQL97_15955, partial [Magnetococcales bacterium]|nr:hypothetical protein [Magnetococcales bacterium]